MFYENNRDNLPVCFQYDCVCAPHFHKAVELLYILSGEKKVIVSEVEYTLHEGDLLVCMPYAVHRYLPSGELQLCATFSLESCGDFFTAIRKKTLADCVFVKSEFTQDVLKHLQFLLDKPQNPVLTRGITGYILGRLLNEGNFVPASDSGTDILREILAYIDEHYAEDITLSSVAKQFGYSKCHFSRLFNARFSTSFSLYVNQVRIYKSLSLLRSHKISTVYDACGFNSPQQYFLNFRKVMGASPREYLASNER